MADANKPNQISITNIGASVAREKTKLARQESAIAATRALIALLEQEYDRQTQASKKA